YSFALRLMRAYIWQPYEWHVRKNTSDINTAILHEVNRLVNNGLTPAMQIIANLLVVLALFLLMLITNWQLALIITAVLAGAYSAIYLFMRKKLASIGEKQRENNHRRTRAIHEAFGGVKEVKALNLEEVVLER